MSNVNQRVGDFCMKYVRGLSGFALVSFLSFQSGAAMSKVPEQAPSTTSSAQTQPVIIAGNPFKVFQDAAQTVDQVNKIRLREKRRREEKRRRKKLEAARKKDAERRRQYFESLSPEEQKAYLAQQEAKQAQANTAAALFMMMLFTGGSGNSGGSDEGVRQYDCVVGYDSNGVAQHAYVSMTKEAAASQSMCM